MQVQTLVLHGDRDVYVREGREVLAAEIPHARIIIYPGTGHALHWDQPQQFMADLQAFLT